jgi:hypothetical protein
MTFADRFKLAAFKAEDVKYKKKLKEDRDKDEEDSILKRFRREQRKKEQARKAYNNRSYSERFNEKSKYYKKNLFVLILILIFRLRLLLGILGLMFLIF